MQNRYFRVFEKVFSSNPDVTYRDNIPNFRNVTQRSPERNLVWHPKRRVRRRLYLHVINKKLVPILVVNLRNYRKHWCISRTRSWTTPIILKSSVKKKIHQKFRWPLPKSSCRKKHNLHHFRMKHDSILLWSEEAPKLSDQAIFQGPWLSKTCNAIMPSRQSVLSSQLCVNTMLIEVYGSQWSKKNLLLNEWLGYPNNKLTVNDTVRHLRRKLSRFIAWCKDLCRIC